MISYAHQLCGNKQIICTLFLVLILVLLTTTQVFNVHLTVVPNVMNGFF